jgi:hypothetical protein
MVSSWLPSRGWDKPGSKERRLNRQDAKKDDVLMSGTLPAIPLGEGVEFPRYSSLNTYFPLPLNKG